MLLNMNLANKKEQTFNTTGTLTNGFRKQNDFPEYYSTPNGVTLDKFGYETPIQNANSPQHAGLPTPMTKHEEYISNVRQHPSQMRGPLTSTMSEQEEYFLNAQSHPTQIGGIPKSIIPEQQEYLLNAQSHPTQIGGLPKSMIPDHEDYLVNPLANVAVQYGSKLMGTGKQMVDKEINRYIPLPLLKLYFSVNTEYVANKIRLVLFPYINKDWSLKYNQNSRAGPRYDANSPDLYIPLMAYLTYVLIAGVILGINDIFQPESLGIIASQALAWTIVEIIVQLFIIYFISISLTLTTFDVLAYSGYKFIGINIIILLGMAFNNLAYWLSLLYCCISMGYFTVQTLKWRLMAEDQNYQQPQARSVGQIEYKRKTYFLVMLALSHVFQMWWLSSSLINKQINI